MVELTIPFALERRSGLLPRTSNTFPPRKRVRLFYITKGFSGDYFPHSGQLHHHHADYIGGFISLVCHIGYVPVDFTPAEHDHEWFEIFGFLEQVGNCDPIEVVNIIF